MWSDEDTKAPYGHAAGSTNQASLANLQTPQILSLNKTLALAVVLCRVNVCSVPLIFGKALCFTVAQARLVT